MKRLGVAATARASVYLYNTHTEIDALGAALGEVQRIFG
jgi:selenocysteine lyase/cysteine desulfurase